MNSPTGDRTQRAPASTRRLTITQKLVTLIVLTTGAIVMFLTLYFPDQQIRASRTALERKAASYGRLVSRQVASAIAFDDRETAREVFDSVAQDSDVECLTLFTANGTLLHQRGRPGSWIDAARRGVKAQRVVEVEGRLAVVSPVISLEGPRGTLVLEISTQALEAAKQRITRTAVVAGLCALCLGALLAYLIARSLGRRIGAIAQVAGAVTAGHLDQPAIALKGSDEITLLAEAFNAMLACIRSLVAQMQKSAQEEQQRLEGLVAARTCELDARNASLKLVLDSVGEGFLSVDLDGQMAAERSAILSEWFGPSKPDERLDEYVERAFPGQGARFGLGWEALREDWMPLELRIDQLPKLLQREHRYFGFGYKPIFEGEALKRVLVVVSDHTAVVEQRLAEEAEKELVQAVRWLLSDRGGFESFLAEADDMVEEIAGELESRAIRARLIHTLKGNASIFGFGSIARLCHELESVMSESGEDLPSLERQRLRAVWERLRERIAPFVKGRPNDTLDVPRQDYDRALNELKARVRHSQISTLLHRWELEPVEGRFQRLAAYAEGLAERLGKGPLRVRIDANDVRLDDSDWAGFWQAVVHVVRNAVDHGLETREERTRLGKPEDGALALTSELAHDVLRIEIRDDGRGIDWERVAAIAREKGLPAATRKDLERVLFMDAVTTAEQVTTTSGRGVGLSAVWQMCEETGARLSIESARGRGTSFTFEWAVDSLGRRERGHSLRAPEATGSAKESEGA